MPEDSNGEKKRKERGSALKERLSGPKASETAEASEASKTPKTPKTSESEDGRLSSETQETPATVETSKTDTASETGSVRDRKNVNMYLPEALIEELDLAREELNLAHKRAHKTDIEKNKHYRALVLLLGMRQVREMDVEEFREILSHEDLLDDPP